MVAAYQRFANGSTHVDFHANNYILHREAVYCDVIILLQKPEKKTPLTMKSLDRATKIMIHVSKVIQIIKYSETSVS